MPELALPDLHLPEAGVYLAAVMFYPRDPARHARLVESARNTVVKRILQRGRPGDIPPAAVPLVVSAATGASIDDEVGRIPGHLAAAAYDRPDIAALMLTYVLACAATPDEGEPATLEHARHMIATAGKTRGSLPGLGRSYLIDIWRDFAPAAHLLATKAFLPQLWKDGSRGGKELSEFLAYAEAVRILGESHSVARSQTSLLDPNETWRAPPRFVLPSVNAKLPKPSEMKAAMARWGEVH